MRPDKTSTAGYKYAHMLNSLREGRRYRTFMYYAELLTGTSEHLAHCPQENLKIHRQRPIANVLQVESYPLIKVADLVPAADLPQTSDSGFHRQLLLLIFGKALIFCDQRRTRPHQAHIAFRHAEQLRQFIQTIAPHPTSHRSDPRIVSQLEHRARHFVAVFQFALELIGVGDHGTKLIANERTPSLSDDSPAIQDWTRRGQLYQKSQNQQQRRQQ